MLSAVWRTWMAKSVRCGRLRTWSEKRGRAHRQGRRRAWKVVKPDTAGARSRDNRIARRARLASRSEGGPGVAVLPLRACGRGPGGGAALAPGVLRDEMVLVCPALPGGGRWTAELESCSRCSSVHLIRPAGPGSSAWTRHWSESPRWRWFGGAPPLGQQRRGPPRTPRGRGGRPRHSTGC